MKYKQRTLATIHFTQDGFDKVKAEYEGLQEKRKTAVDKVKTAREMGDLSENAAYHAARQELGAIDSRMRYLKMQLIYGKVEKIIDKDTVGLGSKVTVKNGQALQTFIIVGEYEADPKESKISINSPIGKALLGKKVGENVAIVIPAGIITYKVTNIG